jgi:aminoglycoside phosphotransferase (APT) family kinase protein
MSSGAEPPRARRTPAGEVDEAIIAQAIRIHAGESPERLTPRPTNPPRFVYEVQFADRPALVFKGEHDARGDDAIVLECWAMDAARNAGAPTPRVIALDTSEAIFPGSFALFEHAAGLALAELSRNDATRPGALEQAGRVIRAVHEIRVAGFGWLSDSEYRREGLVRGAFDSWSAFARDPALAAIPVLRDAGVIDAPVAASYERSLLDAGAVFARSDTRLTHGDLDETHIFVDRDTGALTSIIDWGDRGASDPAWELGVLLLWDGPRALEPVLRGYAPTTSERETLDGPIRLYAFAYGLRLAGKRCAQGRMDDVRETLAELRRAGTR